MAFKALAQNIYTKNTFFLLLEKISRLSIELLVWVFLARYLGPEGLGMITFAQSLVALLIPLVNLGLDNFVVIDCVSDKDKKAGGTYIFTAFILRFTSSVLSFLSLLFFVLIFSRNIEAEQIILIVVGAGILFQSLTVIELYFQAEVRSKYVVLVKLLQLIISSTVKISLVLQNAPIEYFALALLLDSILLGLGLLAAYFWKSTAGPLIFQLDYAKHLLSRSWPLILSGLSIAVYMKIDLVMLKYLVGEEAVGVYSVAARISEAFYFIPVVIVSSLFPAIIKAKAQGPEIYRLRMNQLFSLMALLAILMASSVSLVSGFLVELLFGPAFEHAIVVLQIHVWACLSVFMGVARSKWIANEGLQRIELMLHLAGGLINIGLNLILIPIFGVVGAAIATLLSYFSVTIVIPVCITELRGITLQMIRCYLFFPKILYSHLDRQKILK